MELHLELLRVGHGLGCTGFRPVGIRFFGDNVVSWLYAQEELLPRVVVTCRPRQCNPCLDDPCCVLAVETKPRACRRGDRA